MQEVALIFILKEYVDNGPEEVFLDKIHHEGVVFGTNHSLVEFDDVDIQYFRFESLQVGDLLDHVILDREYSEAVGVLLGAFDEKLDNDLA